MEKHNQVESVIEKAKQILMHKGGFIRTSDAITAGIHPRTLYALRDNGEIEQISRGIFRLADRPPISNPDLITVALRIPRSVICLVSALAYHEITTQIPHAVSIALEKGAESPRISYPPIAVHRFSRISFQAGIEEYPMDGVIVRIYDPEKTLMDCFKFRNHLGMDVVIEALKLYTVRKKVKIDTLLHYARICRVETIIKPYLEGIL